MKKAFGWICVLYAVLFAVACGGEPTPPKTPEEVVVRARVVGKTEDDFSDLFLVPGEAAASLSRSQDSRMKGPDPNDEGFAENHGIFSGFVVWQSPDADAKAWRMVDIRATFPSAGEAKGYLEASLEKQSEGYPPVRGFTPVGDNCHVFGGTTSMGDRSLPMFFYIFTVDNVWVKLFMAQGPAYEGAPLSSADGAATAKAIFKRIKGADAAAIAAAAAPSPAPASSGKLRPTTRESLERTFLTPQDANVFGSNDRYEGPSPFDKYFARHHGVISLARGFSGGDRLTVTTIEDRRTAFATEADAIAYLAAVKRDEGDGFPVEDAQLVGQDCSVKLRVAGLSGGGGTARTVYYRFRRENIVVDLAVIQFPFGPAPRPLVPAMATKIALAVDAHLLGSPVPSIPWAEMAQPASADAKRPLKAGEIHCSKCQAIQPTYYKFCMSCGALLPKHAH